MPKTYAQPESRERGSRSAAERPRTTSGSDAVGIVDPRPGVIRLAQLAAGARPVAQLGAADGNPFFAPFERREPTRSILANGAPLEPEQGAMAAVSKTATGSGAHAWAATEYLALDGKKHNAVMHLTAAGGKGDSASGGSGASGGSVGSDARSVKTAGSVQSGAVSNAEDSGSVVHSAPSKTNVGSANPRTFGGGITIHIDEDASDSYLENMAGKTSRSWPVTEIQADAALAKAKDMQAKADAGKYIYSITGRSISLTKTGMNCARFAEEVVNAAGANASAGWIIKTPRELATGKKITSR